MTIHCIRLSPVQSFGGKKKNFEYTIIAECLASVTAEDREQLLLGCECLLLLVVGRRKAAKMDTTMKNKYAFQQCCGGVL
jgi:hypothetical protein